MDVATQRLHIEGTRIDVYLYVNDLYILAL